MVSPEKSSLSPVQRSGRYVLVLFIVSVAVRAVFLVHYKMIDTDSAYYGNIARLFAAGHWQKALDPYWPPLYPFFASLLYRLGIGLEASGILVSLLASAGTVFLCFFLGKRLGGERAGLIAAGLAAFHPRLISISQSFLTEPLFLFFSGAALALFCRIFDRQGHETKGSQPLLFGALGVLLSLSFLTRPEAVFYLLLILVISGLKFLLRPALKKSLSPKKMAAHSLLLLLLLAGFILPSLPYILRLAEIQGRLTLGEKAEANFYLAYRDDYQKFGISVEPSGYDSITGPAEPRRPGNYHLLQFLQKNPGTILKKSLRNLPNALFDKIPSLMYWPLTLLCLFGLAYRKEIRRSVYDLIFGLWILVPVVIYSPLFLYRRFFSPALIPMIVWCALGLEELRRRLPRKIIQAGAGLGAVLLLFLTNFSISSQSWPTLYKKAGVWLKSHADRPVVLSSRKPETSFYAEAEFRPLNAQKIEDLFDVLKNGNITHLVIDDYIMPSSHPQLADLLDPRRAPPWLIPLFFETQDGHTLILYKFQGS